MKKGSSEGLLTCSSSSETKTLKKALEKATEWVLMSYGVVVYFEEEGNWFVPTPHEELKELDYCFGVIEIDKSQALFLQLCSLLHECGHAKDYAERFFNNLTRVPDRVHHEQKAWEHGEEIALELGVLINKQEWDDYKNACVSLYTETT